MKKFVKKYLNIVLLLSILMSVGCTDQLIENPQGNVSPSTFYKSDGDFQAAVNGCIKPLYLGTSFNFLGPLMMGSGAPDVSSRATSPELLYYDTFKPIPTEARATQVWRQCYISIANVGNLIAALPTATSVSAANKLTYEAQARYIRALCYFHLTRWFGKVQIITPDNFVNTANVEESSVADIYAYIIADLTFAETNLPVRSSSVAVTAPSKGAAKAMLAEVYITMAGWPLKDATKYALARDKAKEVMDMNIYALQPNFGDLWLVANKLTSKEHIFIFAGISGSANSSGFGQTIRPSEEGGWNDVSSEVRFFNAFPAGPRKDFTFWTVFADAAHTTWQNSTIGKPMISKWRDGGAGGSRDQKYLTNGDGFFVISRYADILLTYAEAANKAENGPSTAATDAINLVRRRAGGNNQAVYADLPYGMTKTAFDDAVFKERLYELAFELKPWFDEVRTERVISENVGVYPYVDAHNYLLPKPAVDLDLSPGLHQNPGY